jgi:hypothetical protein
MWLLSGWWTVAAWRAGKPAPEAHDEEAPEQPTGHSPDDVRAATLDWIRQRLGDKQGVHLRDLLAHAQQHGMFEDLDVATFRSHLARLGIPHDRGVKVGGIPTWGVRRRDLEAPSPVAAEESSTEASTAA